MKTITFTCETITPMFLSGADGSTPELRPPSIKGALRFWWRAMNGHLDLKDKEDAKGDIIKGLKTLESEIFGGAGDGKAVRSSFSIQNVVMPNEKDFGTDLWNEIDYFIPNGKSYKLPAKSSEGIAYLLYSTFMLNSRPYIKPNSEFSFKIILNEIGHFGQIINALKGLVFFGGLGTRSRRGGGSFWIKDLVCSDELKDREQELKDIFHNANITSTETLQKHITSNFSITTHTKNDYSHLKNAKIYFEQNKSDWKNALELIGRKFKDFRDTNKSLIQQTPNFGFPILHKKTKTRPLTLMQAGKLKLNNRIDILLERRSSPLIFKLIRVNETYIFPVIIWLSGELIPSDYQIMDKSGGNTAAASTSLLASFFTTKFPALIPITL